MILDASAVLVSLLDEPGRDAVDRVLHSGAIIGSVSASEVLTWMIDRTGDARQSVEIFEELPLFVAPMDRALAIATAQLRSSTLRHGLGLAERACLALARQLDEPVMTADRTWAELDIGVEVVLLR